MNNKVPTGTNKHKMQKESYLKSVIRTLEIYEEEMAVTCWTVIDHVENIEDSVTYVVPS